MEKRNPLEYIGIEYNEKTRRYQELEGKKVFVKYDEVITRLKKTNNVYQIILEEYKKQNFDSYQQSKNWFRTRALQVAKQQASPIIVTQHRPKSGQITSQSMIGKLFMYMYSPKHKMNLPYYDAYPIVFPFKILKDGFLGLNMHYLPPAQRAILMDAMYSLVSSKNMDNDATRLNKINNTVLSESVRYKWYGPCVHRYLNRQIKSSIAIIPPREWELALFLPTQNFKKQTETKVWKDSIQTVKKGK